VAAIGTGDGFWMATWDKNLCGGKGFYFLYFNYDERGGQ
jgi:hypothetical protein